MYPVSCGVTKMVRYQDQSHDPKYVGQKRDRQNTDEENDIVEDARVPDQIDEQEPDATQRDHGVQSRARISDEQLIATDIQYNAASRNRIACPVENLLYDRGYVLLQR